MASKPRILRKVAKLGDRQKKVTSLFELFGTKRNGKTDYAQPAADRIFDFIVIVPLTDTSSAILLAGNNFQIRFPIREPDVWNLAVLARNELVASAFAVDCERVSGEAASLKVYQTATSL